MNTAELEGTPKGAIHAKLRAAIENAKHACERLEEKTAAAAKATDKVVREHPYQAIGIALAWAFWLACSPCGAGAPKVVRPKG
jgi:ElaB/YqjD/DUF883 family membrane-anchored ribosome-binding protein